MSSSNISEEYELPESRLCFYIFSRLNTLNSFLCGMEQNELFYLPGCPATIHSRVDSSVPSRSGQLADP